MKELTKAEEQVMQILWKEKNCFVKDILAKLAKPKPAYNTVSTIVRILESKGFVAHEVFGKSHRYYPAVKKDTYLQYSTSRMLKNYFSGSASQLISFFVKENKLDIADLNEIMEAMEKQKNHETLKP